MKKLLALVLALVMTLGLATVSTSAAYDDAADINYDEAVDVMTAVGVFQGKGNSFDPKANLNRAEAAKIVAYLMLGNDAAEAIKGTGSKFTDVPASHWASGYIEYLASAGVLSGVGGGKFDPNGQVTAIQLAKMLLVALGYDAEIEGFVGSDWSINIQKVANKVGIYDGNDNVVGNNPVTRDEAALYTFNTVKSPMVEYETTTTVNIGDAKVNVGNSNWKYMTTASSSSRYDNIDDATTNDNKDAKIIEFGEQQWSTLVRDSSGTDGFGRDKVVWSYKGTEIGEYVDKSDLILTSGKKVEKNELYNLFGSNDYDHLDKDDGKATLTVYWNGLEQDWNLADYLVKNSTGAAGMSEKGILTEIYKDSDNDDNINKYTIVQVTTWLVQATADYSTSRESVTVEVKELDKNGATAYVCPSDLDTTIEADDFPIVKDVKADDYLLVTWSELNDEYGTVEKATKLTGKVTQYTENDNVTIDGEKLSYNVVLGKTGSDHEKGVAYTINENATVVLDNYGYIIYVDEALSTNSYVFVRGFTDVSGLNKTYKGDAYFLDGTNKEITVKKIGDKNVSGLDLDADGDDTTDDLYGWYTYTVNSDGEYSLKAKTTTWAISEQNANVTAVTSGKVSFLNTTKMDTDAADVNNGVPMASGTAIASSPRANDSTQFIVYNSVDDDINVYTGISNVPDVVVPATIAVGAVKVGYAKANATDTYVKMVFIEVNSNSVNVDDVNDTANYMMILKTTGNKTVLDGTEYYEYKVLMDGEETTKFIDVLGLTDSSNAGKTPAPGLLYTKVKENKDGYVYKGTYMDGVKQKEWNIELSNAAKSIVDQSGNSLIFTTATDKVKNSGTTYTGAEFVVPSNTTINLIVGKDVVTPLLKNEKADYELHLKMSASALVGLLKNYYLSGSAYAAVTDNGGEKVETMYVYLDSNTITRESVDGAYGITNVKIGSTTVPFAQLYANPADALTGNMVATTYGTAFKMKATGSGDLTAKYNSTPKAANAITASETLNQSVADASVDTNVTNSVENGVIIWEVTSTAVDGKSGHVTRYIASKNAATYGITTVKVNDVEVTAVAADDVATATPVEVVYGTAIAVTAETVGTKAIKTNSAFVASTGVTTAAATASNTDYTSLSNDGTMDNTNVYRIFKITATGAGGSETKYVVTKTTKTLALADSVTMDASTLFKAGTARNAGKILANGTNLANLVLTNGATCELTDMAGKIVFHAQRWTNGGWATFVDSDELNVGVNGKISSTVTDGTTIITAAASESYRITWTYTSTVLNASIEGTCTGTLTLGA